MEGWWPLNTLQRLSSGLNKRTMTERRDNQSRMIIFVENWVSSSSHTTTRDQSMMMRFISVTLLCLLNHIWGKPAKNIESESYRGIYILTNCPKVEGVSRKSFILYYNLLFLNLSAMFVLIFLTNSVQFFLLIFFVQSIFVKDIQDFPSIPNLLFFAGGRKDEKCLHRCTIQPFDGVPSRLSDGRHEQGDTF